MQETSPQLSLPFLLASQADKHVTVNEVISQLDTLVQMRVESRSVAMEPTDPEEGQAWLLPASCTGPTWSQLRAGDIVRWATGGWTIFKPKLGWLTYIVDEAAYIARHPSGWAKLDADLARTNINQGWTANQSFLAGLEIEGGGETYSIRRQPVDGYLEIIGHQPVFNGLRLKGVDQTTLEVSAYGHVITRNSVVPFQDNQHSLGDSTRRWTNVFVASGVVTTSDAREKSVIDTACLGLDFINALKPRLFSYKDRIRTHSGLLAQEVAAAIPEDLDWAGLVLADPEDADSRMGLRYDAFIAPLVGAIQELSVRVQQLEAT